MSGRVPTRHQHRQRDRQARSERQSDGLDEPARRGEPPHQCCHRVRVRFGAARSAEPASLWARIQRDIIGRFQVPPFTEQDALAAGDLMAPLVGSGQQLALQDIWLAGVAFGRNLTLVTRNRRDFDRITGLKVEDWFE